MKMILIIIIILLILWLKNCIHIENFQNDKFKFGILICCYNRPEYLEKTLASLKNTDLKETIIYIIDDNSTDTKTVKLINDFDILNVKIIKERNDKNLGITKSLEKGFTYLNNCCEFITNLDSDVILKKNWLEQLYKVYIEGKIKFPDAKNFIVTGFNCTSSCLHKIENTYDAFYTKKTLGGINTFFHNSFSKEYIQILKESSGNKNHGWDWNLSYYCQKNNVPILVTKPSVVQHIGFNGLNSKNKRVDIAEDF